MSYNENAHLTVFISMLCMIKDVIGVDYTSITSLMYNKFNKIGLNDFILL